MTAAAPVVELQRYQLLLLDRVRRINAADYNRQFHPDLSPLGWHLGHCVFTEIYWIREQVLNETDDRDGLKALYVPEFMPKGQRAAALPDFDALCRWARRSQAKNRELIQTLRNSSRRDPLLVNDFLVHFLNQHYAQHYETIMYVLAQRQKRLSHAGYPALSAPTDPPPVETVTVPAGDYTIGAATPGRPYDNEYPAFITRLTAFRIAKRPVSNADYLRFMQSGGYDTPAYWSAEGWRWRRGNNITAPDHWCHNDQGVYYGIDETGCHRLPDHAPVAGISHYEARAYAEWAGARLPHEYEWEAAKKAGALVGDGRVWEWCANAFHPYPGFSAFPYEGYSVPYFDGRHFTLRGGSDYTLPCIRRPSFRNYYEADKRHIRAGLRLVYPPE